MDLHRYAGLVDQLAAEYTLGVLRGGSRRRFEAISQHDPAIRLAVETWRLRLTAMTELGPAVAPPPEIWPAIERRLNLVNARRDAAAARPVPPVAAPVAAVAAKAQLVRESLVLARLVDRRHGHRGNCAGCFHSRAVDGRARPCPRARAASRSGTADWLRGNACRRQIERENAGDMGRPDVRSYRAAFERLVGSLRQIHAALGPAQGKGTRFRSACCQSGEPRGSRRLL